MDFETLRRANLRRQELWGGSDRVTVEFRALEVGGETGELLEAVKKFQRSALGIQGSTATVEDIADELGDVIISCDLLAARMGIDLAEATRRKFNKTSIKYDLPVTIEPGE